MATVRLRLGPADNGRKMTLEEFWDSDDEPGYFFEIVRGVLEVSERAFGNLNSLAKIPAI